MRVVVGFPDTVPVSLAKRMSSDLLMSAEDQQVAPFHLLGHQRLPGKGSPVSDV